MSNPTRGLGRLASTDLRDHDYLLRPRRAAGVTSRTWHVRTVRDQGNTSQCCAYAGLSWLETGPVRNLSVPFTEADLYRDCQKNDEWPGAEPDYEGTSVRALFKVLQARGYVGEYRWCYTAGEVAAHVLSAGPIVLGTVWATEMFSPDPHGFIRAAGQVVGGHAYLCIGANLKRRCPDGTTGAVRILNSWGPGWAQGGRAWVSLSDLDKLMREDGEACAATEVRAVPA